MAQTTQPKEIEFQHDFNALSFLSSTVFSKDSGVMKVRPCQDLLAALTFILSCSPSKNGKKYVLTEEILTVFENMSKIQYEDKFTMFQHIQQCFENYFEINLCIIALKENYFDQFPSSTAKKTHPRAFLLFQFDQTLHGPLYIVRNDHSIQTIVPIEDNSVELSLYYFIQERNNSYMSVCTGPPQVPLITNYSGSVEQNAEIQNENMKKQQRRLIIKSTCDNVCELFDASSLSAASIQNETSALICIGDVVSQLSQDDILVALQQYSGCFYNLVRAFEDSRKKPTENVSVAAEMVSFQATTSEIPIPQTIQETSNLEQVLNTSTSKLQNHSTTEETSESYTLLSLPPKLFGSLQKEHRKRCFGEFAESSSAPIIHESGKEHSGIRTSVPERSTFDLYLGVGVFNTRYETHEAIIPVPHRTQINNKDLAMTNDLNCFNCESCESDERFELHTRRMYSKIREEEYEARSKETKVHLVTFYQRGNITKELIKEKNLKQFYLGFCYSIFQKDQMISVSDITFSNLIEQTSTTTRKRKRYDEKS